MAKIPHTHHYIDISDFVRPLSKLFIKKISKYSSVNAIKITTAFIIIGLLGSYYIYKHSYLLAAVLLQLKNFLDASDGEWARQNNRPSYVGRYYDSIGDFFCNISMHYAIFLISDVSVVILIVGIVLSHLQVSLYVYFNMLYRQQCQVVSTSRLFEYKKPKGYPYDNEKILTLFHFLFLIIYGWQDYIVQYCDKESHAKKLTTTFMTFVSILGGGTQLILTSILLITNNIQWYWIINIGGLSTIAVIALLIRQYKKELQPT